MLGTNTVPSKDCKGQPHDRVFVLADTAVLAIFLAKGRLRRLDVERFSGRVYIPRPSLLNISATQQATFCYLQRPSTIRVWTSVSLSPKPISCPIMSFLKLKLHPRMFFDRKLAPDVTIAIGLRAGSIYTSHPTPAIPNPHRLVLSSRKSLRSARCGPALLSLSKHIQHTSMSEPFPRIKRTRSYAVVSSLCVLVLSC